MLTRGKQTLAARRYNVHVSNILTKLYISIKLLWQKVNIFNKLQNIVHWDKTLITFPVFSTDRKYTNNYIFVNVTLDWNLTVTKNEKL